MRSSSAIRAGALAAALLIAPAIATAAVTDTRVSSGSPPSPFAQNKQNEPAIAVDAHAPNVLAAGSNDEIDEQGCNGSSCPFTHGVGTSGIYFSFNSGQTWQQPTTYTGWSARSCLSGPCTPGPGLIGTLPWYFENGLVSDGDPALAFGPKPGPNGFSWSNGSRLYYGNLTSNFATSKDNEAFAGFEAIAVSRTDDVATAAGGGTAGKDAWMPPIVVSHQSRTTFSDKVQIWADNAASSPFFGTAYVCWGSFVGQEKGHAAPAGLRVAASHDGGNTWNEQPVGAAANNGQRNPLDACTIRTDSRGNAYVFGKATSAPDGKSSFEMMSVSSNGGQSWSSPRPVVGPVIQPGILDAVQGRPTIDGVAGARSDLAPAPSVDIANGAPDGTDATDRFVMTFVSGDLASPHVFFTESTSLGSSWTTPRSIETAGDRGFYTAPAISPNGSDVYVVYNAFLTPYRTNTTDPRTLIGVVEHADVSASGTGAFTELNRGAPGDPRGSSANALTDEFLGDYVYATATRDYGAAVWNDSRNDADCPAVDAWRAAIRSGNSTVPKPAPGTACPPTFGNSDIFGGAYTDPTP